MRLNAAEQESFRICLESFFIKNPNVKNIEIVNHFENEEIARNTIYGNLE